MQVTAIFVILHSNLIKIEIYEERVSHYVTKVYTKQLFAISGF